MRRPDGTLFFLDFEYFGWDDPAKLISDFCWHPAMNLSGAQKRQFASGIAEIVPDRDLLLARLPAAHALFGLKWCTILLNEFLPHHWLRRTFAGDERSREVALTEQLEKSRAVALRVAALHGVFPYLD
ncbi:hypothetical protein [Roseovarius pacificus]|uniref:hypothetical protein n=1 Tax=Roseovarius pacificus TaxID=337701 RepID=UPI002A18E73A|nr:hypothetical protein [Roseovarius pacificus]